jgi:hypothetical protein
MACGYYATTSDNVISMTSEHLKFTNEQVAAMDASVGVLDTLPDTSQTHMPVEDPSLDGPASVALTNWLARKRVASRLIRSEMDGVRSDISIIASPRDETPVTFNSEEWADTFLSSAYAAYHELELVFAGLISVRMPESDTNYRAYQIHKPDSRVHGLGLVVASSLTGHHGSIQLSNGSSHSISHFARKNHRILDTPGAQSLAGMLRIAALVDTDAA